MPSNTFWEIDPTSEDATNAPLLITDATWRLMEMDVSQPDVDPLFAVSSDTEGDPFIQGRHKNREIKLKLMARTTTDAATQTAVSGLFQKLDKLRREGGTLKWTTTAGTTVVADVLYADTTSTFTPELYQVNRAIPINITAQCKPYLRGTATTLTDHVETTLPCVVGVDTAVGGDVPAAVRMVVDEDQGADQYWMAWGVQSRYYSNAATAALFYEAETRTVVGAGNVQSTFGASGGTAVDSGGLPNAFVAFCTTQASGGGAHLSHVGSFRVLARYSLQSNTGTITVALEWGEGDFRRFTQNDPYVFTAERGNTGFGIADLGVVNLTKATAGTQQWQGRFLAKSTAVGDRPRLDCFYLIPINEGSGEVRAVARVTTPTGFLARDEFNQATGALSGKVLPVGGTWSGAGDADDWTVAPSPGFPPMVIRPAISDAAGNNSGRFGLAGAGTATGIGVQADIKLGGSDTARTGVFCRYVDTNNFFMATISRSGTGTGTVTPTLRLERYITGTLLTMSTLVLPSGIENTNWVTIRMVVDTTGRVWVWVARQDVPVSTTPPFQPATSFGDPVIISYELGGATGQALQGGRYGIYDWETGASGSSRNVDNFMAFTNVNDAAIFASQSIELRSDQVIREDSTGTIWVPPSSYEGDYPTIPPAGREARSVRAIVLASRTDPTYMTDSFIDDISYRLTVTPRYLQLPG